MRRPPSVVPALCLKSHVLVCDSVRERLSDGRRFAWRGVNDRDDSCCVGMVIVNQHRRKAQPGVLSDGWQFQIAAPRVSRFGEPLACYQHQHASDTRCKPVHAAFAIDEHHCSHNRDLAVETGQPVRLIGREAIRPGAVVQIDDMDAPCVFRSVAGQRRPSKDESIGKAVHV